MLRRTALFVVGTVTVALAVGVTVSLVVDAKAKRRLRGMLAYNSRLLIAAEEANRRALCHLKSELGIALTKECIELGFASRSQAAGRCPSGRC
jgi:hypothetical protein